VDNWSISDLSPEKISNMEADCYWCLSKLLDGMQDHYTFAQPGIQRLVFKLKELVRRIDGNPFFQPLLIIGPLFALNKWIYTVIRKFYSCFCSVPVHEVCILGRNGCGPKTCSYHVKVIPMMSIIS
jgi:hypothetical protein